MQQAVAKNQLTRYHSHHQVFHDTFIEASQNDLLIDLLKTLRMHRLWYFVSFQYHKQDFKKALMVHKKILKRFESKNTDAIELEKLVRTHIDEALGFFLDYIRNTQKNANK